MKKRITLSFLLLTFVAQSQVIPVGFMKSPRVFVNTPTGPNPVTSNLLLYLDATRSASYGGTGTTWTDISGQSPSNNATLTGSPTFGSGSFTFTSNTNALTSNQVNFSSGTATFIAWVNPSQLQSDYTGIIFNRPIQGISSTGATGLNLFRNNSVGYHWQDHGNTWGWNSNLLVPNNEWTMIAVSISSSLATAYLCKSSGITKSTNTHSHPTLTGLRFYIACDPTDLAGRTFKGKIATAMVYSSTLTEADITAIFNAQKAAFGL